MGKPRLGSMVSAAVGAAVLLFWAAINRSELPLGRADLSAGQSSARIPAEARTHQTPIAGPLGHDTGIKHSLRPP
jgi:hypothetical protein